MKSIFMKIFDNLVRYIYKDLPFFNFNPYLLPETKELTLKSRHINILRKGLIRLFFITSRFFTRKKSFYKTVTYTLKAKQIN